MKYTQVQQIAKDTIEYIESEIVPGMYLTDIRHLCEEKMLSLGADSFWYWDVGAFVFAGDETALSVSGKEYVTSERKICENDIITIDLSPQAGNTWGDYARTIIIEGGLVIPDISGISNPEWKKGLLMEKELHAELRSYADEETTFEELYFHMNKYIDDHDFVNLDFLGNLGHSIERRKEDRIYIENGNKNRLGDVSFFTFEPHIGVKGSDYGYKEENIYYFEDGRLREL